MPVYTRPGRTASKSTTTYLHGAKGCAQWGAFHDVLAASLPRHQRKVTVVREPCSRARSLMHHWHTEFPRTHPIQHVHTLSELASFLRDHWSDVTKTPWPENDLARHHYIVGWPQAWYVDGCTEVVCFERLESDLRGYCAAQRQHTRWNGTAAAAAAVGAAAAAAAAAHSTEQDRVGCAAIRELYAEDVKLHEQHCRATSSVPQQPRRTLSASEPSASSSVTLPAALAVTDPSDVHELSRAIDAELTGLALDRRAGLPPPDEPMCRGRVAMLLVGLLGAAP